MLTGPEEPACDAGRQVEPQSVFCDRRAPSTSGTVTAHPRPFMLPRLAGFFCRPRRFSEINREFAKKSPNTEQYQLVDTKPLRYYSGGLVVEAAKPGQCP